MYKQTILCSALALFTITPVAVNTVQAASSATAQDVVNDTVITAKVKALYMKSKLIKAAKIHVTTINQTVVLNGQLKTKTQYERAITLADSVEGVKGINADHLTVKASNDPLKDSYTTAKVKGIFLKEKLFGAKDIEFWPIKVETKDAVVYLTGTVSSAEEQTHLVDLAQSVQGVQSVKSAITVQ